MTRRLLSHTKTLPAFRIAGIAQQGQIAVVTVLSITPGIDCRAYRGVTGDMSRLTKADAEAVHEDIRAGGDKVGEAEARDLFPEIEHEGLRYRK